MALVTLLTIDLYLPGGLIDGSQSLAQARTAGFTVLVLAQLFNCFAARSAGASALRGAFGNRWLWATVALSAGGSPGNVTAVATNATARAIELITQHLIGWTGRTAKTTVHTAAQNIVRFLTKFRVTRPFGKICLHGA